MCFFFFLQKASSYDQSYMSKSVILYLEREGEGYSALLMLFLNVYVHILA